MDTRAHRLAVADVDRVHEMQLQEMNKGIEEEAPYIVHQQQPHTTHHQGVEELHERFSTWDARLEGIDSRQVALTT